MGMLVQSHKTRLRSLIGVIRWMALLQEELYALSPVEEDYLSCRLSLAQAIEELRQIITMASVDLPLSITNAERDG
jgi:hypothetical protein